ncbi:hypothetical protein Ga0466249_003385 [Sporomusaceae bacterium BoRhaA]|uniref:LamG domain-containing protein n=1 Tax=Pelorhabdus rhamnosifermentans TaxID=2772457 RepID=UPI001C05F114|nr:LamG domain-containing protein [Pelorhabdus rhamnosifermentans]MBU2702258.1 hypothetical protein [Pelorhabdus rhamnosifermentans]
MAVDDKYTVSLLHFDGGITDESGKVWTANNGTAVSTAKSEFGESSLYFNGTSQYLTTPNSSDFDFGTGDFTIDWWEYRTSTGGSCVAARNYNATNGYPAWLLGWVSSGVCYFYATSNGINWDAASAVSMGSIMLNSWTHYAVVRHGSTFYTFQNGTLISTATSSLSIYVPTGTPCIGSYYSGYWFPGYIDEFRVSKGIARWTSNFIPPTAPYSPLNAPTNLTATAGDSQVTLSWTAVTGVTGYNVKRSIIAGGPYTTVGANVSTNSYVDTTVTNGTTYYYVVTTVDADGESAKSNEASATPVASSKALLRVTMSDSSEREYQLSESEIDGFINWVKGHVSIDPNCYMLNKIEVLQNSKDYLMFEKIISFEVMPLTK